MGLPPQDLIPATQPPVPPDLTRPIARAGEEQFAVLCRQRSGMDSGCIDMGVRVGAIEELGDRDQRDIAGSALSLAESVLNNCKAKNKAGMEHFLDRIKSALEKN